MTRVLRSMLSQTSTLCSPTTRTRSTCPEVGRPTTMRRRRVVVAWAAWAEVSSVSSSEERRACWELGLVLKVVPERQTPVLCCTIRSVQKGAWSPFALGLLRRPHSSITSDRALLGDWPGGGPKPLAEFAEACRRACGDTGLPVAQLLKTTLETTMYRWQG